MKSPCDNCLILPICLKKDPPFRIDQCIYIKSFIWENVAEISKDEVKLPHHMTIFDRVFSLTHYPLLRDKSNRYYNGIGLLLEIDNKHLMIGRVPAEKQITYTHPVKVIRIKQGE
jgi:hypothetical protein